MARRLQQQRFRVPACAAGCGPSRRISSIPLLERLTQRRVLGALLLIGWAIYLTVVVASNATDLLASFGSIHTSFRSGNVAFIKTATQIYFRSLAVDQILLGCVLVWEAGAAALLWYGALDWYRSASARVAVAEAGLIVTTVLWMAFAIATEIFVAYERGINESAYWALVIANLATILVLVALRQPAG